MLSFVNTTNPDSQESLKQLDELYQTMIEHMTAEINNHLDTLPPSEVTHVCDSIIAIIQDSMVENEDIDFTCMLPLDVATNALNNINIIAKKAFRTKLNQVAVCIAVNHMFFMFGQALRLLFPEKNDYEEIWTIWKSFQPHINKNYSY